MYGVGVSWGFRSTEELVENGAKVIIEQPGQILRLIRCPPPAGVGGG